MLHSRKPIHMVTLISIRNFWKGKKQAKATLIFPRKSWEPEGNEELIFPWSSFLVLISSRLFLPALDITLNIQTKLNIITYLNMT